MKTEVTAKEEIKEARSGMFWRLYVLPWVLLVLTLAGVLIFILYETRAYAKFSLEHKDALSEKDRQELIDLGVAQGIETIRKEAVNKGYGLWNIDDMTLEVDFEWTYAPDIGNIVAKEFKAEKDPNDTIIEELKELNRKVGADPPALVGPSRSPSGLKIEPPKLKFDGDATGRNREYPFTHGDLEFAKGVGIDLEMDLVGHARIAIQRVFSTTQGRISRMDLELKLKDEVQKAIHKRFDGFETYKKVQ
jgi:hypothetical protein